MRHMVDTPGAEEMTSRYTLKPNDKVWSHYFNQYIEIVSITNNIDWYFRLNNGQVLKAKTPLSYFEKPDK